MLTLGYAIIFFIVWVIFLVFLDYLKFKRRLAVEEILPELKKKQKIAKKENISIDKLEVISGRLELAIEKIKESNTLELEKKEKKLAQLLALLDIIQNILEEKSEFSVDIDIENLLKI